MHNPYSLLSNIVKKGGIDAPPSFLGKEKRGGRTIQDKKRSRSYFYSLETNPNLWPRGQLT